MGFGEGYGETLVAGTDFNAEKMGRVRQEHFQLDSVASY